MLAQLLNIKQTALLALGVFSGLSMLMNSVPVNAAPAEQSWSCRAENHSRIYIVDQLALPKHRHYDVAIYAKHRGDEGDYLGTVRVIVPDGQIGDLQGNATTYNSTINTIVSGRTFAFTVKDSVMGSASGRCSVNWQMADEATRRSVRTCLAKAAQKFGTIPEVVRFGCTMNPQEQIDR